MQNRDADGEKIVLATECRHWREDRPCVFHKKEGVSCKCRHYDAVGERVLVIKLDAMGDVLRSTCVLAGIKRRFPSAWVEWITRAESVGLLERNPSIDRIITYGPDALLSLAVSRYSWVVNLDAGRTSCELATLATASEKTGFVLDASGRIVPTNPAARAWLAMGVSDHLKRGNTKTYQDIMTEILNVSCSPVRYVFELSPAEIAAGQDQLCALGWQPGRPTLGLATGAGGRWQLKQWREDGFAELIDLICGEYPQIQIVLLGGPGERERNERLKARFTFLIDPGCENPVRRFAALIRACDVVLTGDTLAMHLALAQNKRSVVLFGPTSHHEIELFDLGQKIYPDLECLCCYLSTCDKSPNCMEEIQVATVLMAVQREFAATGVTV